MQFDHPLQHRLESLSLLDSRLRERGQTLTQLLALANDFVAHGHRDAPLALDRVRAADQQSQMAGYVQYLENAWKNLREDYQPENQTAEQLETFYRLNGFLVLKPQVPSKKLLVMFTSMFNSFDISIAAAASIVAKTGANILVLKDSTTNCYLQGVEGFSTDFAGIATGIQSLANELGADSIYISGFSSGGSAAMLTSLMLPCRGYLGFTHWTDMSENSPLLQDNSIFSTSLLAKHDAKWRVNLRSLLEKADPNVPRTFIYGGLRPNDVDHGRNIEGLNTIKVICRPQAGHNVIIPLLAKNELRQTYSDMMAG